MKKNVVIVGGGLAGLAAAYELSKLTEYNVTLLEAEDYLGGRVHSQEINGQAVDFGGFIIYPWYKNFHRLLDELSMKEALNDIPLKTVYFDVNNDGQHEKQDEIHHPLSAIARLYAKIIPRVLRSPSIASPNLDIYDRQTVSEFLRTALKVEKETPSEKYFDTVSQGYCYAPLTEYKAAFGIPVAAKSILQGDLGSAAYIPGGTQLFAEALGKKITENGGKIVLNSPVTDVREGNVFSNENSYSADKIIFAQRVQPHLYKKLFPNQEIDIPYTHFAVITLRFDDTLAVDDSKDWGAVFYHAKPGNSEQILSSINLASLYGPHMNGLVNVNLVLHNKAAVVTEEALFDSLFDECATLFPSKPLVGIEKILHWPQTMPVAQESFVEQIRANQGINNYFFAGDFLGCPSMETALTTGVNAAKLVIKSQ